MDEVRMPPQSRVTDFALNPADAHGCPACAHVVTGPAVLGSSDVIVNGLQALRIGDPGVHCCCCGPNIWACLTGSGTVYYNDLNAVRLTDLSIHCGGIGALIMGSDDVTVG
jgi:uncharacterized Zn-binding protein involved in type VI secretion